MATNLQKTRTAVQGRSRRLRKQTTLGECWPNKAELNERKLASAALQFRRLGIDPERATENGVFASQALKVLGPESFAKFYAVKTAGKVIWCNFDLARQLGFAVPRSNQLTPELLDQMLALSLRSLAPGEDTDGLQTMVMYADRYGGDGLGAALGAGRAGFLPYGNLYVKGVGFTPLFKHNDPTDFVHSHGGVHLEDCLTEAIFGEVNHNLFTQGSSRILAIIDQGKYVTEPSGRQRHIALAVRAGSQLRPGHLLNRPGRPSRSLLDKFIAITEATNQMVVHADESTGEQTPDVASTMLRIIDDHARTGADGFRWRMIHGAISSSNMEMSGAMLDLPTQSAQPRTAPVWTLAYAHSVFGEEHKERAFQLVPMYQKLLRRTPPAVRLRFNMKWLNIPNEMDRAYRQHLEVKLLCAVGLKMEVAERLQREQSDLSGRFADLFLFMSRLRNPGSVSVSRTLVEVVSVLDVFHLLAHFPALYFAKPDADHTRAIRAFLKPVYRGNRFHVAKKKATVAALVGDFARLYRELMTACASYAREYYGSLKQMQVSVIARAAFENQPLDALYYSKLYKNMNKAIADYEFTGDADVISVAINQTISGSLRSVDALLIQGDSRCLPGGVIELQKRTIGGIDYSVRCWDDKSQTRYLHVRLPLIRQGKYLVAGSIGLGRLTKAQIQSIRYRFTMDDWKSSREATGRLVTDQRDGLNLDFENLGNTPPVVRLQGFCYLGNRRVTISKAQLRRLDVYTFAIPDRRQLLAYCAAAS